MVTEKTVRILNLFTIMDRGGAETMVMNYYRHIDRTKVQFDFMVHRSQKGAYEDEIEKLGGKIYRFPPIRPWSLHEYKKQLRRFFQEHSEYQVIHAHMSELGYYAFVEAKKAGVPVRICHAHNRPYGFDIKSIPRWYLKRKMRPYITHRFMCGMESGKWLFGEKNPEQFYQLNNAVDTKSFRFCEETRKYMRRKLGVEEKLVVGHVGRFASQKNHTFLIDVFEAVASIEPTAVLLLVGDGEGRGAIEKKAKDAGLSEKVHFLGIRQDIADILQAMDVFVLPSLFEGVSVASIEVQAAGLPCLISDKVPIECKKTDLVRQVSLSEKPSFWAEKILEAAGLPRKDTYCQMKQAGFDIYENAKRLEDFYLEASQQGEGS